MIDLEVFNAIKQECKLGHTINYSALNHYLEVETVVAVRAAQSYESYVAKTFKEEQVVV